MYDIGQGGSVTVPFSVSGGAVAAMAETRATVADVLNPAARILVAGALCGRRRRFPRSTAAPRASVVIVVSLVVLVGVVVVTFPVLGALGLVVVARQHG